MTRKSKIKGVILIALGASSYGMLATFVKMAYTEGFTTPEVTIAQFVYGILGIVLINAIQQSQTKNQAKRASTKTIIQLMAAGTSLGLTSVFYYLSVKFIPVSIAIVLLMQTVWMGVLFEILLEKKLPSAQKIISVIVVLLGTVLATNIIENKIGIDWRGIFLGLLSAVSFTTTMFTANRIGIDVSSAQRSLFMLLGGAVMVVLFAIANQTATFNFEIFAKWGIVLALFGTIIPPLLFNAGFPLAGIGLGSIVSALELPVSVLMAYFLLNESVNELQWIGILLIIFAIFIMNINFKKK